MEKYVPDMYKKSIYDIDYKKLKKNGIKCILFDLDNTLVPYNIKEPTEKVIELFKKIKSLGLKIIIFSNSGKKRLKPFKEILEVDCCPHAFKPSPKKFIAIIEGYKYALDEVAIIGDQLLTDILGGNGVGITTILINPVSKRDHIFTWFNRFREKGIIKKLSKKDIFYRGKYYD